MGDTYFPVSVKESNGRNNYMIQVGTKWSVAHVKRAVLEQSGLQPNQFKLVFAGMELKDHMTLEVSKGGQKCEIFDGGWGNFFFENAWGAIFEAETRLV